MARIPDPVDHLSPQAQRVYDQLVANRGRIDGMYRTLLNHPDLLEHVSQLGTFFRFGDSTLPDALRELAILRLAGLARVGYEWCKHEPVARGLGISGEVISRLQAGGKPDGLPPTEERVLAVVDCVHQGGSIPDDLQAALEKDLGLKSVIELVVLCGFYQMIAKVISSFDVPLPPGCSDPFAARA